MTHRRAALVIASAVAAFLLAASLFVADRPPPPGFLGLVAVILALAWLVDRRVLAYLGWRERRVPRRVARVLGEGLLAGLGVATVLTLSRGEPQVTLDGADLVTWLVVNATLGAGTALVAYGAAVFLCRGAKRGAGGIGG